MMKVRLLNDGGFGPAMNKIKFPVIVDAEADDILSGCVNVTILELIRVGADRDALARAAIPSLTFVVGEFEVVDE